MRQEKKARKIELRKQERKKERQKERTKSDLREKFCRTDPSGV